MLVFVSYSRKDKKFVRRLVSDLKENNIPVWLDEFDIAPGVRWDRAIEDALQNSTHFLLVMSQNSVVSENVRDEIDLALEAGKIIVPVKIDNCVPPLRVRRVQWTDFIASYEVSLERLLQFLPADKQTRVSESKPTDKLEIQEGNIPTETRQDERNIYDIVSILPEPFEWILIPPGKVTITGYGEFEVPSFSISKYPITVAQYELFINDGGYNDRSIWTEAGLAWQNKVKVKFPRYWKDPKFHHSDHPIVGVSWFEAVAFSRWLGNKLGLHITLPSEQQWQRAAQGDTEFAYPWGSDFDENRCNMKTEPKSEEGTTAVTQYPSGASPYGVMDMSGNVWEWTLTIFDDVNETDLSSSESRVQRGGSFTNKPDMLRVDYRRKHYPDLEGYNFGFRVVIYIMKVLL
ncbi:SUMF1/EgtB/PvdO family nonheme iron enzyme [bacterium]|nr:SUMF1/EgtB/PvdO family nonheme iron enzyme [bacterium]